MAGGSNKIINTSGLFFTKNFRFFEKILPGSIRLAFFKYFQKKNVYKSATSLNKHDMKLLNLLKTQGYFVIENFLERNIANKIGKNYKKILDDVKNKNFKGKNSYTTSEKSGVSRINNAEELDTKFKSFFQNKQLDNIIKAYTGCENLKKKLRLELREGVGTISIDDNIHFDDYPWGHRVKAFLYLNGPKKCTIW